MSIAVHERAQINLCALVPYFPDTTPSQRYRIEQWRRDMEGQGIAVDIVPFADAALTKLLQQPQRYSAKALALTAAFVRRVIAVRAARRYDVVLIHRTACLAGPAILERVLACLGPPIIFDFDDAIYLLHTAEANKRLGWLKFPGKTATLCRISQQVVAGNCILADYASRHNSRVTIIPSSVDTERYRPMQRSTLNERIVMGWTGSSTSQTYLEMFAPVLRDIVTACDVELRVHSDREPVLHGVPFVWRPWNAMTEVEEIAQFDIGIMPMPDDKWAQGKCAMKALLYMAMGIPTVCSAVGMNREVVQNGRNGFLAVTNDDWVTHVKSLVDSHLLRAQLGSAGRSTVEEKYSMTSCAARLTAVVRDVVAESQKNNSH